MTRRLEALHSPASLAASLCLALLLGVAAFALLTQPPPSTPADLCRARPEIAAPVSPWRFQTDPEDRGLTAGWFAPDFDDSAWDLSAPGAAWEDQGYEYDGVAWYRAVFAPPAEWGAAYLGLSGVDDDAQLWVNGLRMDWHPGGPASQVVPLPDDHRLLITLRVEDRGGPGGIKDPVRLARQPWAALTPANYIRWLAAQRPDWPMPGWARSEYFAWTFTGAPGAADEALFAANGSVAPWASAPTVSLWLYDPASGELLAPQPKFSLLGDSLPIPQATWTAAGLTVTTSLFSAYDDSGVGWLAEVRNDSPAPRAATLLAVVQPLAVNPDRRASYAAAFDRRGRLWLDGSLFMAAAPRPEQSGVGTLAEVIAAAQGGTVPAAQNLPCAPEGDASAILAYPLNLLSGESLSLSFAFPSHAGAPLPHSATTSDLEEVIGHWSLVMGNSSIIIPDQFVANAYRASLAYLLIALDPGGPRPGPLEHDALWVRDAAYVGEALLGAGQAERVRAYLPALLAYQEDNGRVPAIIRRDGPEAVEEWDAQGQAIFLIAELYRYNRDRAFLQKWYPNVKRAAEFIRALRAQTQSDPPASRGLLPPSKSAEDLGPATWHHYWDDFWAVAGLAEAAFIAQELGEADDAQWMQAEADALRRSIRDSLEAVMGPDAAYIPGAPEDLTSSAMARGASASLFPVEVFDRQDPLLLRSFDYYYERWIAPDGGGYRHRFGQLWPYGGLGLARDYLRLGRLDVVHQILGWTLSHQTLPGTYAWAEQVNPANGGFSGGDMPHAWAAAAYVTLIREMLVMRRGESLQLFAGAPESWLEAGKAAGVRDAPTEFGRLTALVESNLLITNYSWQGILTLTIGGPARPPGGFLWQLLRPPASVDGPPGTVVIGGWLFVPPEGGTVTLRYTAESQNQSAPHQGGALALRVLPEGQWSP